MCDNANEWALPRATRSSALQLGDLLTEDARRQIMRGRAKLWSLSPLRLPSVRRPLPLFSPQWMTWGGGVWLVGLPVTQDAASHHQQLHWSLQSTALHYARVGRPAATNLQQLRPPVVSFVFPPLYLSLSCNDLLATHLWANCRPRLCMSGARLMKENANAKLGEERGSVRVFSGAFMSSGEGCWGQVQISIGFPGSSGHHSLHPRQIMSPA